MCFGFYFILLRTKRHIRMCRIITLNILQRTIRLKPDISSMALCTIANYCTKQKIIYIRMVFWVPHTHYMQTVASVWNIALFIQLTNYVSNERHVNSCCFLYGGIYHAIECNYCPMSLSLFSRTVYSNYKWVFLVGLLFPFTFFLKYSTYVVRYWHI